jgi:hypothetical protein
MSTARAFKNGLAMLQSWEVSCSRTLRGIDFCSSKTRS